MVYCFWPCLPLLSAGWGYGAYGSSRSSTLVQLPDACLQVILQQLVPDHRSICNAARSHSKLQAAAVAAHRSIKASHMRQHKQHKLKSLLLYLRKYPQVVSNLEFAEVDLLKELPQCPQLQELHLRWTFVQLGCTALPDPRNSSSSRSKPGILQAVQQLNRLELQGCVLYDSSDSVAAALAQLPSLQHLSLDDCNGLLTKSGDVLAGVTNLTHLSLRQNSWPEQDSETDADADAGADQQQDEEPAGLLQHIQAMQHLQQLHLSLKAKLPRDTLLGLNHLTYLSFSSGLNDYEKSYMLFLEPAALALSQKLRHLQFCDVMPLGSSAYPGQFGALLGYLEHLTNLTHLSLTHSSHMRLEHLCISNWPIPERGWEHAFISQQPQPAPPLLLPPFTQYSQQLQQQQQQQRLARLPHLRELTINCKDYTGVSHSCLHHIAITCPNLRQLSLLKALAVPEYLQPLLSLSKLAVEAEDAAVLPQLTGLCDLKVSSITESGLLQLTALQQLTAFSGNLAWPGKERGILWMDKRSCYLHFKGGDRRPSVQRQILQYCKNSYEWDVREEATRSLEAVTAQWRERQAAQVAALQQQQLAASCSEQQLG